MREERIEFQRDTQSLFISPPISVSYTALNVYVVDLTTLNILCYLLFLRTCSANNFCAQSHKHGHAAS